MSVSAENIFDVSRFVADAVRRQPAYTPGEQPQGGGWIKLNTNENPFPPSPRVIEAIRRELGENGASLRLYPSPESSPLREAAAKFHGVSPAQVIAGNGSDDVLNLLIRAFSGPGKPAAMLDPSYSLYPVLSGLNAAEMIKIQVTAEGVFDVDAVADSGANIFFLTNPNAPLGIAFSPEKVRDVLTKFAGIVVVDEAYAPFAEEDCTALLKEFPALVVSRTFSKAYALAGMRIGYALAHPAVIETLDKVRDSYNLDRLAQVAGAAALGDADYYAGIVAEIKRVRNEVSDTLKNLGWRVLPSQANFLMAEPVVAGESGAAVAGEFFRYLKENKILVRYFPNNPVTASFLRISIGDAEEMSIFLNIVKQRVL